MTELPSNTYKVCNHFMSEEKLDMSKPKKDSLTLLKENLCLVVDENHPRRKYQRRGWDNKKTIRHWGQRKLLLSEILFLTRWGHLGKTVVYAGAAPGSHIPYLSTL